MGDLANLIREDRQYDYGIWLYNKRDHLGLTQQELGDLAGLSQSTISEYERNLVLPNEFNRAKINMALDEREEELKNA